MAKRVNITIDEELDKKMLVFMAKYHMSKSALISVSVSQYMEAIEMLPEVRGKVSELEKELERLGDLRNK